MTAESGEPGLWDRCDIPGKEHPPPLRPYACGPRCALHTPAALQGRPEPPEPPRKETDQ